MQLRDGVPRQMVDFADLLSLASVVAGGARPAVL
jgi:hypothetical protein